MFQLELRKEGESMNPRVCAVSFYRAGHFELQSSNFVPPIPIVPLLPRTLLAFRATFLKTAV